MYRWMQSELRAGVEHSRAETSSFIGGGKETVSNCSEINKRQIINLALLKF